MTENEKPPAGNRGCSSESHGDVTGNKLQLFERGVKSIGPSRRIGKPPKSGGPRGTVKGWSKNSRRRFREFMVEHRAPGPIYGVTLTVPGPPISPDHWRGLMDLLRWSCINDGYALIWRLELQRRGQPHLHCIASPVPGCVSARRMRTGPQGEADVRNWWRSTWARLIDTLPPCTARRYRLGTGYVYEPSCPRSRLPGADVHAVQVLPDTGDHWYRYLCDHTSKAKQAQISTWEGFRHWGVVNRRSFRSAGIGEYNLEYPQFCKVYRWLRMMSRRRIIDVRCPFFSRRAPSPRRSCQGSAVWFGVSPDLVSRLVALAGDLVGAAPLNTSPAMRGTGGLGRSLDRPRVGPVPGEPGP